MAMTAFAFEETLTFVNSNGTTVAFSTDGLRITFDDSSHAIVTNNETTGTIDLANVDYMCFGEVSSHIVGDVNGDGEVNIADINAVINIILSDDSNSLADVNGDGEVNIADINAIINIILNN
jgi:hypothetical protein